MITKNLHVRAQAKEMVKRIGREPRHFIQIIHGARQVGKTTLAMQVAEQCGLPHQFANCEAHAASSRGWLRNQWQKGRQLAGGASRGALLVLDEIHKLANWTETVKFLWDEDTRIGCNLKVIILGSAPPLMQRGLTESLAGRFEKNYLPHWSFPEMRDVFGWTLEQYIFYGGYPGAARLLAEPVRWRNYIGESIVEPFLSRDLNMISRIDKPAFMRQLFEIGSVCSGQIVGYTKLAGRLQEAGHVATLAHYLDLLREASMLAGLGKYSGSRLRRRRSAPKLQVFNTALMTYHEDLTPARARADGRLWGRLVESAVGAHLVNLMAGKRLRVHYWRDGDREVDFVVEQGDDLVAIEVKSGRDDQDRSGMVRFADLYPAARRLQVGGRGIPVEQFLALDSF